jgi:excisionase family DNA binding protein
MDNDELIRALGQPVFQPANGAAPAAAPQHEPMAKPAKTAPAAPETLTVEAAAKRLRIGRNQCYEAVARGELPAIKIGRRILIPVAALDALLRGEPRLVAREARRPPQKVIGR